MNRPYTICLVASNFHGKIDGTFFDAPESAKPLAVFRKRWKDIDPQAVIYGASTMAMYANGWLEECDPAAEELPREDYVVKTDIDRYYVCLDNDGSIAYESGYLDVAGRGRHAIIVVLPESIDDSYLAYLRELGISYIFAGEEEIDAAIMSRKLLKLFGIQKALLAGGGYTDWTLLKAGVIDEIQMLQIAVIDACPGTQSAFEDYTGESSEPIALKMARADIVDHNNLLLTYIPANRREDV